MMRIGRLEIAIGGILVATAITTGIFRSGGTLAEGIPSGAGSIQLVILVIGVLGTAYLAARHRTDRLSKSPFETNDNADTEETLEALKQRYATGEIDEIEFERKLETLFETETVADAKRRVETHSVSDDQRTRQESVSESDDRHQQRSEQPSKQSHCRSRRDHCK